eukprot:symbB.v1.2.001102.t2/scaffold59.1/size365495/6
MAPAEDVIEEEDDSRFIEDDDDSGLSRPWAVDMPAVFLDVDWELVGDIAGGSEHPVEISLLNDFTLVAWVRGADAERRIMSVEGPNGWMLAAGSNVRFATGSALVPSEEAPDAEKPEEELTAPSQVVGETSLDGEWHHVLVVFKASGTSEIYVDGQLDGEDTVEVPEESMDTSSIVVLGEASEDSYIKDLKVFRTALTKWQVEGLFNNSKELGTGLTLSLLPEQVEEYWKLKRNTMVCPLCFIPPAVAGLWGGALLTAPTSTSSEACEHCNGCDKSHSKGPMGPIFRGPLSAALGVAGALPLAYLGWRRWRGGRWGLAAGCLLSSSTVLVFSGYQLSQVILPKRLKFDGEIRAAADGEEGWRELLQVVAVVATDPFERSFQVVVLMELFEDLMAYAKTICLTSRKTSVIVQIVKDLLDMMHRKSETSRRFGETSSIFECFQEFKRMLVAHSHAAFATAQTLPEKGEISMARLGVFRTSDLRLLTEFITGGTNFGQRKKGPTVV